MATDNDQTFLPSDGKYSTESTTSVENSLGDDLLTQTARETFNNRRDIDLLKQELSTERSNNFTVFGIFASLLTFLSVEIQIFKNIDNFWTVLGFTSFLLATLLIFILCIHFILKDKLTWIDFLKSPIFWLFIVFLFISMMFLLIDKQGIIEINIKI